MNSQEITSKFDKPRVRKNLLLTKLEEGGTLNLDNKIAAFKKLETDKGKKNKKTVRMIVRGVKFPFFQYFLLFFFMLLIFIGFFIFLLYESQMLDDSLYNSLSQNNYILSMKSDNFEALNLVMDMADINKKIGFLYNTKIHQLSLDIFRNKEEFIKWLTTDNFYFDKKKPVEYLETISGIQFIYERMEGMKIGDNV